MCGLDHKQAVHAFTEAETIVIACPYDPQGFDLDPEAAELSLFGTLVASGLHILSACFGRIMGSGVSKATCERGNRIDTRWPAPLGAEQPIAIQTAVVEIRPSRSGRPLGIAVLRHMATRIADGVGGMEATGTHFLRR